MIFRTDPPPALAGQRLARPDPHGLLNGDGRYRRVPLGGRPTELAFAPDGKTLYVANYLADAVQVVDAESANLVRTIPLGGPKTLSLARRGEILFHAAERSFNQWYSCNTCHSDGHTNGLNFDTLNDGRQDLSTSHLRSRKKVPTLRRVTHTGPWTWHGWQTDLDDAMVESFTKSMQGPRPSSDDVKALIAYLDTLEYPRNPYTEPCRPPIRRSRARQGRLPVRQGGVQHLPRRPRTHRRQDPRRRPRRARRRLPRLQPPLPPRPLRQGPLPPRRPLQDPARSPHRPPQRRHRLRPGRADRGRAGRSAGIREDALMARICRSVSFAEIDRVGSGRRHWYHQGIAADATPFQGQWRKPRPRMLKEINDP